MTASLPDERDFDPSGNGLDEQTAWKHFGGLTLEEAQTRFREAPELYQEDFMFMGGTAFAFYFPVVDSYLREASDSSVGDDRRAWILACCIKLQFSGDVLPRVRLLAPRVLELPEFVQTNLNIFAPDDIEEQTRIGEAWQELKDQIKTGTNR